MFLELFNLLCKNNTVTKYKGDRTDLGDTLLAVSEVAKDWGNTVQVLSGSIEVAGYKAVSEAKARKKILRSSEVELRCTKVVAKRTGICYKILQRRNFIYITESNSLFSHVKDTNNFYRFD